MAVVVAVVLAALAMPATARADPATGDEVRALAEQAQSDPAALDRLRAIDEVDGQPVDLAAALGNASGTELQRRLDELAAAPKGAPAPPGDDRDAARRIVDGRKYNPVEPPRPFKGLVETVGGWLSTIFGPVVRPIGDVIDGLLDSLAGTILLAVIVVGLTAYVGLRLAQRRAAAEHFSRAGANAAERGDDPHALERMAEEAERRGELSLAYRLRFRAGLLRLDARGAIQYRPSMTTGALARAVLSPTFAHLAVEFDEVAYGDRPVAAAELEASRQVWRRVLEEAGTR